MTTKKQSMAVRQRVTRLKDRIMKNIQDFAQGVQEPDSYKINPEHLGAACQRFGSLHDCLAEIYDCQQLLHTKFEEHEDTSLKARIKDEAKLWSVEARGWSVTTSTKDAEQLLAKIQHALERLDHNPSVTEPAAMNEEQAASRICMFRVHLGENNVKASKGSRLKRYGRAVDLTGPRANVFHNLLGSQDRQFTIACMLTELDSQDVRKSYQTFTEMFADGWTKGEWIEGVCVEYEEGLIKQEKMISDALKRERHRRVTAQPFRYSEQTQLAEKPSRNPLPPHPAGNQVSEQQTKTRRRRTESANPPRMSPTDSVTSHQSQNSPDAVESQHNSVGREASESMQGLTEGPTPSIENQRPSGKSDKLNVRLDLAGSNDTKTSRKVRWSPNDSRDMFFRKVAELFPGPSIQQISVNLHYGTPVNVQATGPEGEWEIVQDEWLERLGKTSK
jgi:hypothetical protein